MNKFFFLLFLALLFPIQNIYAPTTYQNTNFEFDTFNLNITNPITVDSFLKEPDSFTTSNGESLRKYIFYNSSGVYNVHFDIINSTMAQYNITDIIPDAMGNVTGAELARVELDTISYPWVFDTDNIVSIFGNQTVEYWFTSAPAPPGPEPGIFNAIVLRINSPEADRLGGVFAISCPTNSTLTGLLSNGTFICTDMSVFFP